MAAKVDASAAYQNKGHDVGERVDTKSGISLQMQMLIGFLVGLIAGLAVNMGAGDAAWVDTVTT